MNTSKLFDVKRQKDGTAYLYLYPVLGRDYRHIAEEDCRDAAEFFTALAEELKVSPLVNTVRLTNEQVSEIMGALDCRSRHAFDGLRSGFAYPETRDLWREKVLHHTRRNASGETFDITGGV